MHSISLEELPRFLLCCFMNLLTGRKIPISQLYHFSTLTPSFPSMCLSILLCTVGSFSEHLDQINGRHESVDSTDNSSKPPSDVASHMARQQLENTEKKIISGKVTKSLSASALSLMIPGGRDKSFCLKCYDLCILDGLWCKFNISERPEWMMSHFLFVLFSCVTRWCNLIKSQWSYYSCGAFSDRQKCSLVVPTSCLTVCMHSRMQASVLGPPYSRGVV